MGRTKPCLEEQRKPLSLSLSLFLVESSVDSQPGAYCASRESFARQIDIFRGTLVCAQEEEEHGVCTRSRRLARRSWDSWKLRERRTEETPQSAFPEKLESSPLRGAATWAEEVEKSPRFFTLWKEKGIGEGRRKRWRGGEVVWDSPPRGGRARAFETRFSSPIHLFLSSTPIEKRCSRAQLSEEWIPLARRRKEIPFSDPRLVQSSGVEERRGCWRIDSFASPFARPLFKNFRGNFERRKE